MLLNGKVIGEVLLKHIDPEKMECALGIHLQNDSVKGRGYGTQAERRTLDRAFDRLEMKAVNADVPVTNPRSAHAAEKAGFRFLRQEGGYRYCRAERKDCRQRKTVRPDL